MWSVCFSLSDIDTSQYAQLRASLFNSEIGSSDKESAPTLILSYLVLPHWETFSALEALDPPVFPLLYSRFSWYLCLA